MQDFAELTAPLSGLTSKDTPERVICTPVLEGAFKKLKNNLIGDVMLTTLRPNQKMILQIDASGLGVRGVLSQIDDQGKERPIAYYSRKMLPRERNYSTLPASCE